MDSKEITALDALIEILTLLGYEVRDVDRDKMSVEAIVEGGLSITIKIDNNLEDWGEFDRMTQTASINFAKSGNVTDMALIALHEISHAVLDTPGDQESIIYSVEYFYAGALWWSGIKPSRNYMDHLTTMENLYDPNRTDRCPINEALERWMYKTGW